jgi:DNA (cytosine-5)-methyltransferase 1
MKQLAFRLHGPARMTDKWIVDLFCGAGGASQGIERALGRSPNLCINHNPLAIANHQANHPTSLHDLESVWKVDPRGAVRGNPVGLLWMSPDCTHFSRAKGAKPVKKRIRSLANVGIKWARDVRPDVIMLENVMEFRDWGPLGPDMRPIPARKGEYFRRWVRSLERLGYQVDHRVLRCADYGAPTSRRRLFLVARCDGQAIRWPEATHGKGRALPERVVAECINFNLPCRSIFDPARRPLAEATNRRLAAAAINLIVEHPAPFLYNVTHGGRVESLAQPIKTITGANRGEKALVVPAIARIGQTGGNGAYVNSVEAPLTAITSKAEHCLVEGSLAGAVLVQTGYGERKGQAPRVLDLQKPAGTLVDGQKHALGVGIVKHFTGVVGHGVDRPLGTITAKDHHSLLGANLSLFYGNSTGQELDRACPTITAGGPKGGNTHLALETATLIHYYGQGGQDQPITDPLHAIVGKDRHALVTGILGDDLAGAVRCCEFLIRYGNFQPKYAAIVDGVERPVVLIRARGALYLLTDLGLRMLQPEELKLAQGFDPSYILLGTKADRVKAIGNSVPPQAAEALVRANLVEQSIRLEAIA